MAFRYSRSAMTGAAIFTLAGVTVLPLAQANAAPASPQGEGASSASQNAQGQQQSTNGQGQQAQVVLRRLHLTAHLRASSKALTLLRTTRILHRK